MDKSSESSNRKTRLRRGAWTPEEDRKLSNYITRYGTWNWSQLPIFAGLSRSGKSCRLRWNNYLRPDIKRGNYTAEEEEVIINLHKSLGNKYALILHTSRWTAIAAHLPGRTDNEIKNHWHTQLKKRSKKSLNPKGGEKLQPDEASVNNVAGTKPEPGEASENNADVEDYLHLFFFKHRY